MRGEDVGGEEADPVLAAAHLAVGEARHVAAERLAADLKGLSNRVERQAADEQHRGLHPAHVEPS
jgi:hypothetical protein